MRLVVTARNVPSDRIAEFGSISGKTHCDCQRTRVNVTENALDSAARPGLIRACSLPEIKEPLS